MNDDLAQTIQRFESYLSMDSGNLTLWLDLAGLYELAGRGDDAEVCYEKCLEISPSDAVAASRRASYWLSQGRYAEAEHTLRELIEGGDDAVALQHNLGVALYGQRRWQEAARQFEQAHQGGLQHRVHLAYWARALHGCGDLTRALEIGERLLACDPSREHHGYVALLYLESEQINRAAELADVALQAQPQDAAAHVVLGQLALGANELEQALEHFSCSAQAAPHNARAWLGVGLVHLARQDPPQAIHALECALRDHPDSPGNRVALGWAHLLARDLVAAECSFREAIEVDRNFGESHGSLACALALQGQHEAAEPAIRRARGLSPHGFAAEFAAAVIQARQGDQQSAARAIEELLNAAPREGMPTFAQLLAQRAQSIPGTPPATVH